MDNTMNVECTAAFLFALWAFATGHWIAGTVATLFIVWRMI